MSKPITDAEAKEWQDWISGPDADNFFGILSNAQSRRLLLDRTVAMEILGEVSKDCCWFERNVHWMQRDDEGSCGKGERDNCPRCKARALIAAVKGGE